MEFDLKVAAASGHGEEDTRDYIAAVHYALSIDELLVTPKNWRATESQIALCLHNLVKKQTGNKLADKIK